MLVVNDVTHAASAASSVKSNPKAKSTVTSFQDVLEKEQGKVAEASQREPVVHERRRAGRSETADKYTGSGSSAETTLKGLFERASEKYNVPYDFLVAVAKAESNFNTKCVSSAGAQGIMQLMPETGRSLGVRNPFDAEENIMAAAKLLRAHLDKFDGNYTLAAAAYNAGGGAVAKYGGVPPYTETQTYVKRIRQYMQEGVKVPDRKVTVSGTDSSVRSGTSVGSGGSAGKTTEGTETQQTGFDTGIEATDEDLAKVIVAVGSGDSKVTMTYGAYLKYLELGTTGVG